MQMKSIRHLILVAISIGFIGSVQAQTSKISPTCDLSTALSFRSQMRAWKYPETAFFEKREGVAIVRYTIDRDGNTVEAKIEVSSGDKLVDEAAIDRYRSYRFHLPVNSTLESIENRNFCDTVIISWNAEAERRKRLNFANQAAGPTRVVPANSIASFPGASTVCSKIASPIYPRSALILGYEAEVLVHIQVGNDGRPRDIQVVKSTGLPEFRAAAIEAAKKFECQSADTEYIVEQQFGFILDNSTSDPVTLNVFKPNPGRNSTDEDPLRTASSCPAVIKVKLNAPDGKNEIEKFRISIDEIVVSNLQSMEPDFEKLSPSRKGSWIFVRLPCQIKSRENFIN
jgi:TonB family protein